MGPKWLIIVGTWCLATSVISLIGWGIYQMCPNPTMDYIGTNAVDYHVFPTVDGGTSVFKPGWFSPMSWFDTAAATWRSVWGRLGLGLGSLLLAGQLDDNPGLWPKWSSVVNAAKSDPTGLTKAAIKVEQSTTRATSGKDIEGGWGVWTHILVWSLVLLAVAAVTMGVLYYMGINPMPCLLTMEEGSARGDDL